MKHCIYIFFFLLFAYQGKAQSDSSQFAIVHFTDFDLEKGIISLTWNDGQVDNIAQILKIDKPLKTYRSSPAKMEIQVLQFMDKKGYELIGYNAYTLGTSSSKWIFRKKQVFKVY